MKHATYCPILFRPYATVISVEGWNRGGSGNNREENVQGRRWIGAGNGWYRWHGASISLLQLLTI